MALSIAHKFILTALEKSDFKILNKAKLEWFDDRERKGLEFVKKYYTDHGELPQADIYSTKFSLTEKATGKAAYHLRELKNRYITATLTSSVPSVMRTLGSDPQKGLEEFKKTVFELSNDTFTSNDISYSENASERYDAYKERMKNKGITHLSTGSPIFDQLFYGYRKADLVTIASRSGVGKSWFMLFLVGLLEGYLKSIKSTQVILFISNEMPEDEIIERIDSIRFKLPYGEFMSGSLSKATRLKYKTGLEKLATEKSNVKIIYNCSTIEELQALVDMYNPAAVFIDGSYLMEPSMAIGWEKITYITRSLKSIAKIKSTPIINTTQLIKGGGKKASKISTQGQDEFAGSTSYIQDSDIAMRMYQDDEMVFVSEIGIDVVKARRAKPNLRLTFINNLTSMQHEILLEDEDSTQTTKVEW